MVDFLSHNTLKNCMKLSTQQKVIKYIKTYRDLLGCQKVPVSLQISALNLFVVDLHLICVVRSHNQCVKMSKDVILKDKNKRLFARKDFMDYK